MFRFKQFTIHQDRTSMKVGTDGVLLGAWCFIEGAQRILDIGTGTGLIAIMTAQRTYCTRIDAIEIEQEAYIQAKENVNSCPWKDRIEVYHSSLQDFTPSYKYDSIVCNPPFFTASTKNPNQARTLARHNDSLPLDILIERVSKLLSSEGEFSVILPINEANELIDIAKIYKLYVYRSTEMLPTPTKAPKRMLIGFRFQEPNNIESDSLVIELSRHIYSSEYKALTKDFYLNLK